MILLWGLGCRLGRRRDGGNGLEGEEEFLVAWLEIGGLGFVT
jgi:hypothetical protein